ncbi:MAG: hypothetical protein J6Y02_01250 [Pseudobutyrivibrio sp.]|nr:hypothetical protein [Pseudobutyrivibrio sp.]
MTNGDVIKGLFPGSKVIQENGLVGIQRGDADPDKKTSYIWYSEEWWNKENTDQGKRLDMISIQESVMILDLFAKTYCRYLSDYERFGDLKFRCDECIFQLEGGKCLIKKFKAINAPDYKDFGSMGDL